jgi:hypothetical protein
VWRHRPRPARHPPAGPSHPTESRPVPAVHGQPAPGQPPSPSHPPPPARRELRPQKTPYGSVPIHNRRRALGTRPALRRTIARGAASVRRCLREPCRGVAEVEAAGAVEGFFGAAGWHAAGEQGVLVVVVAGAAGGEPPGARGAAAAQAAELDGGSVGGMSFDVGEGAAEADLEVGKP